MSIIEQWEGSGTPTVDPETGRIMYNGESYVQASGLPTLDPQTGGLKYDGKDYTPAPDASGLIGGSASNTFANITREQYADYVKNYIPIEDQLIKSYKNPVDLQANLSTTKGIVNNNYAAATQDQRRQLGKYGLSMTAPQQKVSERVNALGRTASLSTANNFVRQLTKDRDQAILTGSTPGTNYGLNAQG